MSFIKYLILSIVSLVLINSCYALDSEQGKVSGQLRFGAVGIKDSANQTTNTLALGGKLSYQSPNYKGLSAGVSFYTTNPLGGIDEETLFLSSKAEGYSLLGEAFLNAKLGNTNLKLGRQEIDTPFADTDDVGMIANTFEALMLTNTSLPHSTITAAYLYRWAGVDADTSESFSRLGGNKGVSALGISYEPSDQWVLQGWHYRPQNRTSDATDISYLDAEFKASSELTLATQYINQSGGFNGEVWGLSAEYAFADLTLTAAYNDVSGGQVTNGFGGGPYFTSAEDHTIAEVNNQKATAVGLEYTGFKKLTLGASYADFKKGENEWDLSASFAVNKTLTLDVIYSDMNKDGKMSRTFLNYNF